MKRFFLLAVLPVFLVFTSFRLPPQSKQDPPFLAAQNKWVDSVFNALSADERIGQLFMIAAYSNKNAKHTREIKELVEKCTKFEKVHGPRFKAPKLLTSKAENGELFQ